MNSPYLLIFVGALAIIGCTDSSTSDSIGTELQQPKSSSDPHYKTSDEDDAAPIQVAITSWSDLQGWVSEQRGKVVVIDVWSTYCLPCVKEFPHFVELHRNYLDSIACASLSLDYYGGEGNSPEDVKPQVQAFLTAEKATMTNFISSAPDAVVLKEISANAVPVVLVYDRQGQLHTVFSNDDGEYGPDGFSYEKHISPVVKQLLK